MEYLVTMTTNVPDGTPAQAVEDIRTREAARSRELAAEHHLLRLWRPPLQPGEWRTLGLFAADDDGQLDKVLTSMPLHVWRTDQVTPLAPHVNDPGPWETKETDSEFLTEFTITIPKGMPSEAVADARMQEADCAHLLAQEGHLRRLWGLPGQGRSLGLWRAKNGDEIEAIVKALPLDPWMATEITPLTRHPNDPASMAS